VGERDRPRRDENGDSLGTIRNRGGFLPLRFDRSIESDFREEHPSSVRSLAMSPFRLSGRSRRRLSVALVPPGTTTGVREEGYEGCNGFLLGKSVFIGGTMSDHH